MRKIIFLLLALVLVITLNGCGGNASQTASRDTGGYIESDMQTAGKPGMAERAEEETAANDTLPQKIIKTVSLTIVVPDVEEAVKEIEVMVKKVDGYVQDANLWQSGGNLQGHLTLRVPSDRVEELAPELESLGKLENKNISGQDVTEEYYDVEARRNNLQRQEERYLELLDRADTVEDMLKIENELARLRGEIESLEARLKVLNNRVDLATVNVELRAPRSLSTGETLREPFGERIQAGWQRGVNGMVNFVQDLVVLLVILIPYLPVFALIGYVVCRVAKKRRAGRTGGGGDGGGQG